MDMIKNRLSAHTPEIIGERERFHSAVCIPLIRNGDRFEVLFEVRSSAIPDQPGDICLPGGEMEPGETPWATALRESCEELLIRPEQLKPLGPSDYFHTDNLVIYPFAAELSDYDYSFSTAEVAEVFSVPLDFFLNTEPERHQVACVYQPKETFPYDRIQGGRAYRWRNATHTHLFYQYGKYTIWGMTALILHAFAQLLAVGQE